MTIGQSITLIIFDLFEETNHIMEHFSVYFYWKELSTEYFNNQVNYIVYVTNLLILNIITII